jgi:hypothetical protein
MRGWVALPPGYDPRGRSTYPTAYLTGGFGSTAALGARSSFEFLPGRSHFDVYQANGDPAGLYDRIAAEMYAVARPKR